jgi:hypothetical protein
MVVMVERVVLPQAVGVAALLALMARAARADQILLHQALSVVAAAVVMVVAQVVVLVLLAVRLVQGRAQAVQGALQALLAQQAAQVLRRTAVVVVVAQDMVQQPQPLAMVGYTAQVAAAVRHLQFLPGATAPLALLSLRTRPVQMPPSQALKVLELLAP